MRRVAFSLSRRGGAPRSLASKRQAGSALGPFEEHTMRRIVAASLLAVLVGTTFATPAFAANEGKFCDGTSLGAPCFFMDYGDSDGSLGSFDNAISSYQTTNPVGHGFILWTGIWSGSSHKVCGSSTRNTMPTGFNNTVSSIQSTSNCPV